MQKVDIRQIKTQKREESKSYRLGLLPEQKQAMDTAIRNRLMSLRPVIGAKTVLCYMSTDIEVDTRQFILQLLSLQKRVALPRCVEHTRWMNFYLIRDFSQTERHTFGVFEPIPAVCPRLTDFSDSVCIVPGLGFDRQGYRLGYGKGYYDRFLSSFRGRKIGICYEACLSEVLPHGYFDVAVDWIVTEKRVIRIHHEKRNEKKSWQKKKK